MFPEHGLPLSDHSVPPEGLDAEAAGAIMRTHIDCPITACPVKLYAKTVLVREGRLRPAERPKFGF
ncbi:hypothetical protein AB0H76_23655 [Nocardia sp. NPDC050712]|uniref:hypothetical protein n=1 Tax=Nocardia sp. NPDC050712 TaxID=3155518 RepID=UPI0033E5ADF5